MIVFGKGYYDYFVGGMGVFYEFSWVESWVSVDDGVNVFVEIVVGSCKVVG